MEERDEGGVEEGRGVEDGRRENQEEEEESCLNMKECKE